MKQIVTVGTDIASLGTRTHPREGPHLPSTSSSQPRIDDPKPDCAALSRILSLLPSLTPAERLQLASRLEDINR